MTREPLAWVLNLDAEHELELGGGYTPSLATRRALADAVARFAAQLPATDVVLGRDPDARAHGLSGRCYCPTPSALRRLERAGAIVSAVPNIDIVRTVNERAFGYALGHLEGARRCTDEHEVDDVLAHGGRWLLKRGLGFAGRGQRPIDGAPSDADRAWIRASLRRGALYVEPRVVIEVEVAIHGLVEPDGTFELGRPTLQDVRGGAWRGSRLAGDEELDAFEREALHASGERAATALARASYFGPFGVDAFRYRIDASVRFHAFSELNARYTMAWATGMGGLR